MRFIIGFIFFGLLFYAIWHFFPGTFETLVTWAGNTFNFIKGLIEDLIAKFQKSKETPIKETTQAALFLVFYFLKTK